MSSIINKNTSAKISEFPISYEYTGSELVALAYNGKNLAISINTLLEPVNDKIYDNTDLITEVEDRLEYELNDFKAYTYSYLQKFDEKLEVFNEETLSKIAYSYTYLKSVYNLANQANNTANAAYGFAGDAYALANSAYNNANNAYDLADTANDKANDAYILASTAYETAKEAKTQASENYAKYITLNGTVNNNIKRISNLESSASEWTTVKSSLDTLNTYTKTNVGQLWTKVNTETKSITGWITIYHEEVRHLQDDCNSYNKRITALESYVSELTNIDGTYAKAIAAYSAAYSIAYMSDFLDWQKIK